MEKQILQWSYWLGLAISLLAMVWKGLATLGVMPEGFGSLLYSSLYKGGVLFLLISLATAMAAWLKGQKA
jgi:hypothetical protein